MITITTDSVYITVVQELTTKKIQRNSTGGLSKVGSHVIILTKDKQSWTDIDFNDKPIIVNGVTQTSVTMLMATLSGTIGFGNGAMQEFLSTAGQTVFTTLFPATTSSQVFVDGNLYTLGVEYNIPGGVVTFNAPGLLLNQIVIIYA